MLSVPLLSVVPAVKVVGAAEGECANAVFW